MTQFTSCATPVTKRRHASPERPREAIAGEAANTVMVPLAGGAGWATVDRDDYLDLIGRGLSRNWTANINGTGGVSVRAAVHGATGHLVGVARLIMLPKPGWVVRFRDGNTTNLCRDNLYLSAGRGWRDDDAELRRHLAVVDRAALAQAPYAH